MPIRDLVLVLLLALLAACATPQRRLEPAAGAADDPLRDAASAPPAAPAFRWPLALIRFEGDAGGAAHDRLGVQIGPDLVATSLDTASYPADIRGIYLIEHGERVAALLNAVSGNATDLDIALMRVYSLGDGAPYPRPAPEVALCETPAAEGTRATALGLDGQTHLLLFGAPPRPGDHMRTVTAEGAAPPSGAPVVVGDCLAGIYTASRLVEASGIRHLLGLLSP